MSGPELDGFRQHLIDSACDPASGMDTQQRTLLSLISLPHAAQEICTEAEREHVVRTVQKAMDAAVAAALSAAPQPAPAPVARFHPGDESMVQDDAGHFVRYADYAALSAALPAQPAPAVGETEQAGVKFLPIALADNSIATVQKFGEVTIRNSYPVWVRDEDGRVYEAVWTDHKGGYWWDLDGESPVDPVEFAPHPLAALSTEGA